MKRFAFVGDEMRTTMTNGNEYITPVNFFSQVRKKKKHFFNFKRVLSKILRIKA